MSEYDISYEFDESSAMKAEAGRIDTSGAYVCKIMKAEAQVSQGGTHGVMLAVSSEGNGEAEFTLWTKKEDGTPVFGYNQLQSVMMLTGVRSLRGAKGKVSKWDNDTNERVEAEGTAFPDLVGKMVGLVLQKELYTTTSGKTAFRMNLSASFHYETRLTCSEMKERKVTPEKLERILARLKDKDSRKVSAENAAMESAVIASGF